MSLDVTMSLCIAIAIYGTKSSDITVPHAGSSLDNAPVVSVLIPAGTAGGSGRVISAVTDTKSRSRGAPSAWLKVKPRCNQPRPYVARLTLLASSIEGKRDSIPSGATPPMPLYHSKNPPCLLLLDHRESQSLSSLRGKHALRHPEESSVPSSNGDANQTAGVDKSE
jgi:hypothetical protein